MSDPTAATNYYLHIPPGVIAAEPDDTMADWAAHVTGLAADITRMAATGRVKLDPGHVGCDCGGTQLVTTDPDVAALFDFRTAEEMQADAEADDEVSEFSWPDDDDDDDFDLDDDEE